jgi:hypothetical protein
VIDFDDLCGRRSRNRSRGIATTWGSASGQSLGLISAKLGTVVKMS